MSTNAVSITVDAVTPVQQNFGNTFNNFIFGAGGGAMLAGAVEISIFHPFDTVSKRLMNHHQQVVFPLDWTRTKQNTINVITKGMPTLEPGNSRVIHYIKHLYPGSFYAMSYKILQRLVKFAGQPYVRDYLNTNHRAKFIDTFGTKKGKGLLEAVAGVAVGIFEVVLLPFDRMKILSQTNRGAVSGSSLLGIVAKEGPRCMYAGACATATRNTIGSFLLFGGTAFTKEYIFGIEDYRDATFAQNMISSSVGAMFGVFCTSPIDVVKTRIQAKSFGDSSDSAFIQFFKILKTEGINSFYKGIIPKLATAVPRLTLSFTLAQYFTEMLRTMK
eukprot:Tbor_TRINITY_DN4929_c5_g3::TRINITY_DN4929_c5_g3_i1::g.9719::m.9719